MPEFMRTYPPAQPPPGPAYWLPFRSSEIIVQAVGERKVELLQGHPDEMAAFLQPTDELLYLGTLDNLPCLACSVNPELALDDAWSVMGLRSLYGQLDEPAYGLAGYASQMLGWQRTSRFCPACAHATETMNGDWGRKCSNCGHVRYPPVSPAVLVLVHDGDQRLLLTHKPGWGKMYSLIAGFVEPGEALEECVRREVLEEVGLTVAADLVYVGSQPWAFPHQIMVGFLARYLEGEIKLDTAELDDAIWYEANALPSLPAKLSLSRQIIDQWLTSLQPNL